MEDMVTMVPGGLLSPACSCCCTIWRAADWQVRNVPFRFVSKTSSNACSVISRKGADDTMPGSLVGARVERVALSSGAPLGPLGGVGRALLERLGWRLGGGLQPHGLHCRLQLHVCHGATRSA